MDIYFWREKLGALLSQGESECADFKEIYYLDEEGRQNQEEQKKKKVDFLHDILCMANSYFPDDRYIVFGIKDSGEIVGVSEEAFQKIQESQIIDLMRNAGLNKPLYNYVKLQKLSYGEKKLLVLRIKNVPQKPFFLEKDYGCKQKIIRAGVVYTRNKDSNTPINQSASDDEVSLMWRERFGLDTDTPKSTS